MLAAVEYPSARSTKPHLFRRHFGTKPVTRSELIQEEVKLQTSGKALLLSVVRPLGRTFPCTTKVVGNCLGFRDQKPGLNQREMCYAPHG